MRSLTLAIALGSLLLLNLSASADTFTLNVTGNAYDVQEFAGFNLTGTGLSVNVANDFGPPDIGLVPGQSYSFSYTVGSEYFDGRYGDVSITGNGSINWRFTLVVPNLPPDSSITLQVPGTVTGYFNFCSPAVYEEVSSCGPEDNPLGSATFTGTGTDTADLICSDSGTCSLYADYLEPFTATADMNVVPEPPTLALILGSSSLLAYPTLLYIRRPSSRRLPRVRSS
jgi:hypothetical protein